MIDHVQEAIIVPNYTSGNVMEIVNYPEERQIKHSRKFVLSFANP